MASNAQTILNDLLEHERKEMAPKLSASDFFELFTAEQILKNYGLNYEEIQSGIVDYKGGDGGIDSIYTFVNGVLVSDEADFENIKQNALVNLIVIQSKVTPGFSEDAILRLEGTVNDLLNISHKLEDFTSNYNTQLLRAIEIFRNTYRSLMPTSPELQIIFYFATTGYHIHPNVEHKAENLKKTVKRLFTESTVEFHFYGAEQLLTLRRKSKVEQLPLNISEALTTESKGTICLVPLKEFYDFIYDAETGELRGWLFEENVRDYEGKNIDVNKGIRQTLEYPQNKQDFWWLNNGITIVASRAPLSGKVLSITDPKIVNGLQTSMEIFSHFRCHPEDDERNILVRTIVTDDEKTRNDIIIATNSQSAIKAASLRAFDPIHYKIEQYFALHGFFYDRRKNFYKNQGKPKDKIISVQYLSQAIAAILLQRPNDSRGRPTNLIKNKSIYDKVFDEKYPINVFLECVHFMKSVDAFLVSVNAPKYVRGHEVNVRYHLAMFAAAMKVKRIHVTTRYIQNNGLGEPSAELLTKCLKHVWKILQSLRGENKELDEDRIAKSPDFDDKIFERLRMILKTRAIAL